MTFIKVVGVCLGFFYWFQWDYGWFSLSIFHEKDEKITSETTLVYILRKLCITMKKEKNYY